MSPSVRSHALRGLATLFLAASLLPIEADGQSAPSVELQWHLKARSDEPAGADVRAAWLTTKGTGVVIGIVDDGLQYTHPDLAPNYSGALSINFNGSPGGPTDPSPTTSGSCARTADCHGTSVSGVAGAAGIPGGTGVSGAAPSATLAGIRLIAASESDADEAAAFSHEPDAIHILSNSWGPADDGATLEGPGPLAEAARATSATTGRGGKGRIFVWAAGNGLQSKDNCNFDGYANSKHVIAVGAVDDTAGQAWYSEPCSAMFVTAPSDGGLRGITTTDLVGAAGDDPGDFTSTFGGTSSATPVVSGTVALMLARNPALTARDVKYILRQTAVRINPLDAGWTPGAYPHNEKFGFGLVDARAAASLAATWTNVAAERAIPPVTDAVARPIPDNNAAGLTRTVLIGSEFANFTVEHVEVIFDATHPFRGDLAVTLTSPSGVESHLATVRPGDSGNNFSAWRFGTVRHWGESAQGVWALKVADLARKDVGTWNSWTLKIYGWAGISPDPLIAVTPGSLNFGSVAVGSLTERTFTVQNIGGAALTGNASAGAPFSVVSGSPFSLEPGESQPVVVSYSPVAGGLFTGTVTFTSNGGSVSQAVSGTVPAFALAVGKSGTGAGTVTSSPSGINCGTICSASFFSGTGVTLTAAPASGSAFAGWSGCDSVSGNTCSVTMSGARSAGATFQVLPTLKKFTPASGVVGTTVTISGTNLTGATGVQFTGASVTAPTSVTAKAVKAVVPAGATTGPISVLAPGGTSVSVGSFKVLPKITGFSPSSGVAGTSVTIIGTNLKVGAVAPTVKFGTVVAAVVSASATQVVATAPVKTGKAKISVTTADGKATSATSFTVTR